MLKIISHIQSIESFLADQLSDVLKDYKIILKTDMEIGVHLLVNKEGVIEAQLRDKFSNIEGALDIKEVLSTNLKYEQYYSWLFNPENNLKKVDLGLRKRFNNLIDFAKRENSAIKDPFITTFYSYKGGMGRSTTLASFASYCAKIHGKRIAIVDCDFEAPGFTNYFDLDSDILSQKNGIVEYFLDKQFVSNTNQQLDIASNYSYKVGYEYAGKGEIFVVPAGNLSNEIPDGDDNNEREFQELNLLHRDHYLEALSRLDLSSVDNIIEQFADFVRDLKAQLNPDIVLFDSRTGFNDTFPVLACLSEIIVGFFGNNIQNRTGLEQFLQTIGQLDAQKDIILVNSNILGGGQRYYEDFGKQVEEITKLPQNQYKFIQEEPYLTEKEFKIYQIEKNETLQNIGTKFSYKKESSSQKVFDADFVTMIEKNTFFQPLFEDLFNKIEEHKKVKVAPTEDAQVTSDFVSNNDPVIVDVKDTDSSTLLELLNSNKDKVSVFELRKNLLAKLSSDLSRISRYADDAIPDIKDFYFRDCMKDMFNRDKFLIIGSKGTGKTALYQAFRKNDLRQKLQVRSNILSDKHLFVNVISIHKEENAEKYLETTKFNIPAIQDTDFFFERFWVVYVWNAIMLDASIRNSKYFSNELPVLPITQEPETVNRFESYINDNGLYTQVFSILKKLDEQLKEDDKNLIILFEQLDYVVKPEYWSQGISPLINFWRSNPFNKILPKIFLRSDLFNQLTNITNSQNLPNRSIYIEWTKEELFVYFFKLVLQSSKYEFYLLMYAHFNYSNLDFIIELDKNVIANDNQVPTDEKYLRPLVETFFGKYANWSDVTTNNDFGESYNWFERNLKDANDMISLRPFLNLIERAIEKFIERAYNTRDIKSILSASFYADNQVREYAVEQHFQDLAKEKGNRALLKFHKYITVDGPTRIKVPTFRRLEFNDMLNQIFMKYKGDPDLQGLKKIDDLKLLLLSNGIIKETDNTNRKYTNYVIPFLYRNYLRVSNRNLQEGHKKA